MSYTIRYRPGVERDMRRLPRHVLRRADNVILALSDDPRPSSSLQLKGATQLRRIRIGDWRVVYEIDDTRKIVEITLVAHRREVYRGF